MKRFLFFYYLKRGLTSGYTWSLLVGLCFIGGGWLMQCNGISHFQFADKYGQAQSGAPDLLYWLGGSIIACTALRGLLFRMAEVKKYRAERGDTLLSDD